MQFFNVIVEIVFILLIVVSVCAIILIAKDMKKLNNIEKLNKSFYKDKYVERD